jgi:putative transposase
MKVEYHNLYTHFVFTTYKRLPLISKDHRERIEKYITGIIKNNQSQLYSIYANPDHVHFIVSCSANISAEQLAGVVADSSERFINENNLCNGKFKWQNSCSAFSVSKSDVVRVCRYIENQPIHHKSVNFETEYEQFLKFYQKTLKLKSGN